MKSSVIDKVRFNPLLPVLLLGLIGCSPMTETYTSRFEATQACRREWLEEEKGNLCYDDNKEGSSRTILLLKKGTKDDTLYDNVVVKRYKW